MQSKKKESWHTSLYIPICCIILLFCFHPTPHPSNKNLDLMIKSEKDLDLLEGVYGDLSKREIE